MRNFVFRIVAVVCLLFLSSPSALRAADIGQPIIDRESSENAFLAAYDFLLENRLWNCLDSLDDAMKWNTFFIDVYYMRSLVLRRIGRYEDASGAMSSYLEVRYDDHRAGMILDSMVQQRELLRRTLYPGDLLYGIFFEKQQASAFFKIPMFDRISYSGMRGIGKISSDGDVVFVCDALGDGVLFSDRTGKQRMGRIDIPGPIVAVPLAPSKALLVQKSGDVSRLSLDSRAWSASTEAVGSLGVGVNPSDAAVIDSTLMAVTDRTGQAVRFYSIPQLDETASWRPPVSGDSGNLFEPVAAAVRGPFLAIADRGNDKVYVLDSYTLTVQDVFDVELPRDLEWGQQGELYIVSETGRLYRRYPVRMSDIPPDLVSESMKNAWSLTWTRNGPAVSDISGRIWWSGGLRPKAQEAFGALSLHSPWIDERSEDGVRNLILRAYASSSFQSFIRSRTPDVQVVWRNESRPSRVSGASAENSGSIFYYSPYPAENIVNDDVRRAVTISDVINDVASASRAGTPLPKALVLDTRISGSDAELDVLFALALQQGIRLDLWSLRRPASTLLTRISQITLGYTYNSASLENVPMGDSTEWILSVPLPPDSTTYGYPSDATLSVFGAIDMIQFNDWLPIWPSMLSRESGKDGAEKTASEN
jgi:hypothetical protein